MPASFKSLRFLLAISFRRSLRLLHGSRSISSIRHAAKKVSNEALCRPVFAAGWIGVTTKAKGSNESHMPALQTRADLADAGDSWTMACADSSDPSWAAMRTLPAGELPWLDSEARAHRKGSSDAVLGARHRRRWIRMLCRPATHVPRLPCASMMTKRQGRRWTQYGCNACLLHFIEQQHCKMLQPGVTPRWLPAICGLVLIQSITQSVPASSASILVPGSSRACSAPAATSAFLACSPVCACSGRPST